jgi:hypothetical protein
MKLNNNHGSCEEKNGFHSCANTWTFSCSSWQDCLYSGSFCDFKANPLQTQTGATTEDAPQHADDPSKRKRTKKRVAVVVESEGPREDDVWHSICWSVYL